MTTPTVADTLAWQELSPELQEQYKRAMYDEISEEVIGEENEWDFGYHDGRRDMRKEFRGLVEDAETALAADPPNIEEAKRILDELSREVG